VLYRGIRAFALVILSIAAFGVLHHIYEFGQTRFFSVDEYQFGHASWLVSQGRLPYLDFYEHHFPLSYALHAPLVAGDAAFDTRALRLRMVTFLYLLALAAAAAAATWTALRDPCAALLASFLPLSIGFGLMSQIDYRADTIAAYVLLAALCLLEINRSRDRRALAAIAGAAAAIAALMTQKMALLGGVTLIALLGCDLMRAWRLPRAERAPLVRQPLWFAGSAAGVFAVALGVAAWLGLLGAAYEITVVQAARHEARYPAISALDYLRPFLAATPFTTIAIATFALGFLAVSRQLFWLVAVTVAVLGGWLLRAQYPYSYVYLCILLGLCAVRGFGLAAARLPLRGPVLAGLRPLVYLAPLAILPDQLGFVSATTSNEHQLALLRKVERLTSDQDTVIDSAGGALFRPHGSYYWYHGDFHRELFDEYFRRDLVRDYRLSRAPLWIRDFRVKRLPAVVVSYLRSHYIRLDGELFGLGFEVPETSEAERRVSIDVIRPGHYHLLPTETSSERVAPPATLELDGSPVESERVYLSEGRHRLRVPPHSPAYRLSYFPPSEFRGDGAARRPHAMTFQYGQRSLRAPADEALPEES